jgi:ketosteroid isomerase-like protein
MRSTVLSLDRFEKVRLRARRCPVADQSGIVGEVETAYRRYVEVFNSRDANEISSLYDRPHAHVSGEMGLSIVSDDADQQGWYEFVMAHLDDQGWDRTEVDDMWVWPLSPTLAQLVADVTRYRRDGSVLSRARANYTLRRRDDAWKVILTYPLLEDGFDVPGRA